MENRSLHKSYNLIKELLMCNHERVMELLAMDDARSLFDTISQKYSNPPPTVDINDHDQSPLQSIQELKNNNRELCMLNENMLSDLLTCERIYNDFVLQMPCDQGTQRSWLYERVRILWEWLQNKSPLPSLWRRLRSLVNRQVARFCPGQRLNNDTSEPEEQAEQKTDMKPTIRQRLHGRYRKWRTMHEPDSSRRYYEVQERGIPSVLSFFRIPSTSGFRVH